MELDKLRAEIDVIDTELAHLFERRMELVTAIGEYKKEHDLPIYNAGREEQVLGKCEGRLIKKDLTPYLQELMAKIMEISVKIEFKNNL